MGIIRDPDRCFLTPLAAAVCLSPGQNKQVSLPHPFPKANLPVLKIRSQTYLPWLRAGSGGRSSVCSVIAEMCKELFIARWRMASSSLVEGKLKTDLQYVLRSETSTPPHPPTPPSLHVNVHPFMHSYMSIHPRDMSFTERPKIGRDYWFAICNLSTHTSLHYPDTLNTS